MGINHAGSRNAALNMERWNIVMSAGNIHVKNMNMLMNMILLLPIGGKSRI